MDEYIDVKIDVFEHTAQRAKVRKNLTITALVEEILREFDDITADSPEKYAVYLKGFDRPLTPGSTLTQLDIQPQDELIFDYVRQTIRQMLDVSQYAILREESTGKEFDIQWQPAVIGRPSTEVDHNIILAVNVQLLPDGKTISRKHAQTTVTDGRYFIEPMADQNPVYLNGRELPVNTRREIKHGDRIAFGRNKLTMTLVTQQGQQRDARPSVREPASQPAPRPVSAPSPSIPRPASPPMPSNPPTPIPQPIRTGETTDIMDAFTVPTLVIEASASPARVGQKIEMGTFPFTLGRSLEILGTENEVSRKHAEITYSPQSGRYFLTDLQSTNGVSLNGQRIAAGTPFEITHGAKIGLGSLLVLRFEK
jgi:pSer/pThr/pTyr-binding forkhead associated (FHA) protein